MDLIYHTSAKIYVFNRNITFLKYDRKTRICSKLHCSIFGENVERNVTRKAINGFELGITKSYYSTAQLMIGLSVPNIHRFKYKFRDTMNLVCPHMKV